MSNYFYHPLGDQCSKANIFSYIGHGIGKLDIDFLGESIEGTPFYAMTDGKIVFCGTWPEGDVAIVQECTDSNLGITFYIRYLHGINNQELLGTYVKKGTQLGLISNNAGKYRSHLHIDFSFISNGFRPVKGTLISSTTPATWTCEENGQTYTLPSSCDLDVVEEWARQNGGSSTANNGCGYCWLVFSQNPEFLTQSSSGIYTGNIDVSSLFKTEADWNALYGMIAYEENVLFNGFENGNIIYKAILEWVIRVFRNRLFAGMNIDNICLWNSGLPGRASAESRASSVPSSIREFARNIISGNDYFYVEQVAKDYKYGNWDTTKWYNRLYSADTFYGGYTARWPGATLAQVPFEYGPYFFMEGEFTYEVKTKFWPNGLEGESTYPNPYPMNLR